jgi:poly(A) polymerase
MTSRRRVQRLRGRWLREPSLGRVLAVLNDTGTTRIAGGAVRNDILGFPVAEVDLATTLAPTDVIAAAERAGLRAHPTGIDHGTVTVVADGRPFEVTTLRVDVETFGRKARVAFTDDWEKDAARRDFTMNALYCDRDGTIHDPLAGYGDVERRRVRFVGRPSDRIAEDHLRILRFFRFHAQYGRGSPDADGLSSCVRLRRLLSKLSAERIRQELWKLLVAPGAVRIVELMVEKRIAEVVLGRRLDVDSFAAMTRIDAEAKLSPDALLRLEALTGDALAFRDRLRLTTAEARRLEAVAGNAAPSPGLRPAERRVVLYHLGRDAFADAVRLAWARSGARSSDRAWRSLLAFGRRTPLPTFPLKGRDILDLGVAAGPDVGRILKSLEDWWIAAGFSPDRDLLLARARSFGAASGVRGESG